MQHIHFYLLAGVLITGAFCPAANELLAAHDRPNIILVITDDQRWDQLGCTGHPVLKTPHIDRIAREGASFSNFFVTTPLCSPLWSSGATLRAISKSIYFGPIRRVRSFGAVRPDRRVICREATDLPIL
jgi:hypothetical protein